MKTFLCVINNLACFKLTWQVCFLKYEKIAYVMVAISLTAAATTTAICSWTEKYILNDFCSRFNLKWFNSLEKGIYEERTNSYTPLLHWFRNQWFINQFINCRIQFHVIAQQWHTIQLTDRSQLYVIHPTENSYLINEKAPSEKKIIPHFF